MREERLALRLDAFFLIIDIIKSVISLNPTGPKTTKSSGVSEKRHCGATAYIPGGLPLQKAVLLLR